MELGIYTFGATGRDPRTGEHITVQQRTRNLLEEIELADQLGLDVFGVGEHHRPAYVADERRRAADEWFASFAQTMNRIGRERGWPPLTRQQYDASLHLRGANVVGSPEEVAEKILWEHEIFGHDRTLLQFSVGPLPHADVMHSIELFGTKVAPIVREEVARRATSAGTGPERASTNRRS